MRQSKIFSKTSKQAPKDEVSFNAQLLIRAGFIHKEMAGVYTLLPLGWRVFKKIENIIREEINAIGGLELFMPTLHPQENWQKTGRWNELDVLFKLPSADKKFFALGPTHEEIVVPLAKNYLSSYKDLPFALYHIQNKFRNEKRAKSGILRGREFMMKDLYSFHADQKCLDEYYEKAKKAYVKIFDRCGIGEQTYLTYASGGTFAKYSHEYQALVPAGEDTIYVCDHCRVGVNREIIQDQKNACPECGQQELREEKGIEVGNIFKLGAKFSEPFGLSYTDEQGQKQSVVMGCYGIGLQRLMGTIVELSYDDRGIIWPETVAPFKIHLISLGQKETSEKLYAELQRAGKEVFYDDREEASPGQKFADADLIGCPYRVVVSEKSLAKGGVELKNRKSDDSEIIALDRFNQKFI